MTPPPSLSPHAQQPQPKAVAWRRVVDPARLDLISHSFYDISAARVNIAMTISLRYIVQSQVVYSTPGTLEVVQMDPTELHQPVRHSTFHFHRKKQGRSERNIKQQMGDASHFNRG